MKTGYDIAIKTLVKQHKTLTAAGADPEQLKSIAEGIEHLCYPYREDLAESVPCPLHDPKDEEKAGFDADNDLCRRFMTSVRLKEIAWDALQYLRSQGVDC